MDLAKIRQKARQERDSLHPEEAPIQADSSASTASVDGASSQQFPEEDIFQGAVLTTVTSDLTAAVPDELPVFRNVQRNPVEVILSGRKAAGCHDNVAEDQEARSGGTSQEYQEYLCFRVSNEVYGINIMDIKELIKPRGVTEVPRAPSFVSGVISLRGVIIPVIDMLDRLGLARKAVTGRERVIVVRHGESFSGLLVDEITQVVRVATDCIEAAPTVLDGIDRDFVSGLGRSDGRMIILLNIENITDINLC